MSRICRLICPQPIFKEVGVGHFPFFSETCTLEGGEKIAGLQRLANNRGIIRGPRPKPFLKVFADRFSSTNSKVSGDPPWYILSFSSRLI